MSEADRNTWQRIGTYLFFTLVFSAVFWGLIIHTGHLASGGGLFVLALMWCPGLAGLLTRYLYQGNLDGHGWRWGRARYPLASYLIPIAYATPVYLVAWFSGLASFNTAFLARASASFGWPHLPVSVQLLLYVVLLGTFGMVGESAHALGEELGWRGFLVPELAKVTSYRNVSLISGICWACWHYPLLLFADYNAGTPAWYGLACFTVMVVGTSFVFAWMRLRSGSVWTGMLLHASHNLFIQSIFDRLTGNTGRTPWITGEFGIGLAIMAIVVAVICLRHQQAVTAPAAVEVR